MTLGRALTPAESLAYLGEASTGRIALSVRALPYVFMAPIRLVTGGADGLALDVTLDPVGADPRAMHGNVVAVHTDGIDLDGARWQVLVRGRSTLPEDHGSGGEVERARVKAELIRGWTVRPSAPSPDAEVSTTPLGGGFFIE